MQQGRKREPLSQGQKKTIFIESVRLIALSGAAVAALQASPASIPRPKLVGVAHHVPRGDHFCIGWQSVTVQLTNFNACEILFRSQCHPAREVGATNIAAFRHRPTKATPSFARKGGQATEASIVPPGICPNSG